jgi:hypothetical protein
MKKTKFYNKLLTVLVTAGLFFCSCNKLDETVYSAETPETFFKTADQLMAGYVMPYSFMQTHIYQVHFAIQEFSTDEAVVPVRGGYVDQNGAWMRLHQHTWTSSEPWIELEWVNLFQAIGYCNFFIDAIKDRDLSSMNLLVSKEQMIAEIKMVRALHYYWALSNFGNIPIVEHVGELNPPTKSSADVFAFIEKEIKENMPFLSEKGDPAWYGHFTKTAAHALLAKLYLNAEVFTGTARWNECITESDAIINSGKYSLDPEWNTPFLVHNESSNENIYVVPFDANSAPQFNAAQQQLHWTLAQAKYNLDDGWYKTVSQESFYNLYEPNDERINQWVVGPQWYTDENGEEQPVTEEGEQLVLTAEIQSLFNTEGGYTEGASNIKYEVEASGLYNMSNDLVVFRLSDIMFMKAECLMRLNGNNATQQAVDLVNQVRARSFARNDPDARYTTSSLTMNELLDERGREFAYEMHRREDLIRFDRFTDAWWEKAASDQHRELYPIPVNILTANPSLQQNPGY